MKLQYLHELSASFALFVDHEILEVGEAFTNVTSGALYPTGDSFFANYPIYQSPSRQWVSDSSIGGANIPSGIVSNGTFIPRGVSGVQLGYNMGRAFLATGQATGLSTIKCSYAKKDFNVMLTSLSESELLFESANYDDTSVGNLPNGALQKKDNQVPVIYVRCGNTDSEPFALGGEEDSQTSFTCIILADSAFKLDGAVSILQDSARKVFPLIPSSGIPFNQFGDLKSGISSYDYPNLCQIYKNNLVFIEKVRTSKLDERVNKLIGNNIWGALVDFSLSDVRLPRQ
jgi:hypothetical protein